MRGRRNLTNSSNDIECKIVVDDSRRCRCQSKDKVGRGMGVESKDEDLNIIC